jgi:hypothetical protein
MNEGANIGFSPLGDNFTLTGLLHPWVITSPLGANFTSGDQIPPLGVKLKTDLRIRVIISPPYL